MYAKKYEETPNFIMFGNKYNMLLPRNKTECTEVGLVKAVKGSTTPRHAHAEEEQIYFVLAGRGILKINGEKTEVERNMIVYIPRNSEHEVTCTSDEDLIYSYVAVWPKGIPEDGKDWKKAYKIK